MDEKNVIERIKKFIQWPLWFGAYWLAMAILFRFAIGRSAALLTVFGGAAYMACAAFLYKREKTRCASGLIRLAAEYGQIQNKLLKEFILPYALLDMKGGILWMNDEFAALTGKDNDFHKNVAAVFPQITNSNLPGKDAQTEVTVAKDDRKYRAAMTLVDAGELFGEDAEETGDSNSMIAIYLFDETELAAIREDRDNNRICCGLLSIDNYEEALESVEELRRSLLVALVERKINKYFADVDGIVRKTEKDKYFFLIRKSSLDALEAGKFSLLEDVKTVNVGNELALTISMGISYGSHYYIQNAEQARSAIDIALGRGGDQVVVKARVKAHALKEIITGKSSVFIMGHHIPDMDVLGAAVGIYACAKSLNKPAYIVMDKPPDAISMMVDTFKDSPVYGEEMFISSRDAIEMVNSAAVLVVVDTNKPSYTECEDLLRRTNAIVVLDHHRQGKEMIQNAVLSYIEPYASSASEMVAEIVQYFDDALKIRPIEADAMYGGIMVDTSNFLTRTGVRTFEAAAYLRRNGADVTRIRKMLRDTMEDVRAKSTAIAGAEIYEQCYAISICPSSGLKSPTVVCAQTANELLSVVGVKASFVLTFYNNQVYISARAIDEVNVQLIMERLGGGGHLNIAGAQLQDTSVSEAVSLLKSTISEMQKEGDI